MKSLDDKLVEKLNAGVVCFTFRKKNGEIRYAAGTNNQNCMDETPVANTSNTLINYFDLTKRAWRNVSKGNIMRIGSAVNA